MATLDALSPGISCKMYTCIALDRESRWRTATSQSPWKVIEVSSLGREGREKALTNAEVGLPHKHPWTR